MSERNHKVGPVEEARGSLMAWAARPVAAEWHFEHTWCEGDAPYHIEQVPVRESHRPIVLTMHGAQSPKESDHE